MQQNKYKIDQEVVVVSDDKVVKTTVCGICRGRNGKPYYHLDGVMSRAVMHSPLRQGYPEDEVYSSEKQFRKTVKIELVPSAY